MKKILEIDQYWKLLNQYQEKIPDMVYNHMMLPGEAASHIEAGKLYYEEQKKGIVFSVKEKDFCKLYFIFRKVRRSICQKRTDHSL